MTPLLHLKNLMADISHGSQSDKSTHHDTTTGTSTYPGSSPIPLETQFKLPKPKGKVPTTVTEVEAEDFKASLTQAKITMSHLKEI